jgi:hypothetical protein
MRDKRERWASGKRRGERRRGGGGGRQRRGRVTTAGGDDGNAAAGALKQVRAVRDPAQSLEHLLIGTQIGTHASKGYLGAALEHQP